MNKSTNVFGSFFVVLLVALNLFTLYNRWFCETISIDLYSLEYLTAEEINDSPLIMEQIHSEYVKAP